MTYARVQYHIAQALTDGPDGVDKILMRPAVYQYLKGLALRGDVASLFGVPIVVDRWLDRPWMILRKVAEG